MSDRLILAQDGWGDVLPDWVEVLVRECDQSSQNSVAVKLGLSATVVSQAMRNRYGGSLVRIEAAVRDVFMSAPVLCPALKTEIPSAACLAHRRRAEKWTHSSPFRVRMIRACRACRKFNKEPEE
ncbi:hypothetical protein [Leisingera sp. M658]|uniref:hypothetical protein n=1 Tax=Leisingera sp. M658 TaxID=2867015 RepID=UPI0021A4F416|nr:hypothetical protein [Leisingera sp. M658]UWQ73312.1 hypothetical protein K3724_12110 [Leisingera sp. M658]